MKSFKMTADVSFPIVYRNPPVPVLAHLAMVDVQAGVGLRGVMHTPHRCPQNTASQTPKTDG